MNTTNANADVKVEDSVIANGNSSTFKVSSSTSSSNNNKNNSINQSAQLLGFNASKMMAQKLAGTAQHVKGTTVG